MDPVFNNVTRSIRAGVLPPQLVHADVDDAVARVAGISRASSPYGFANVGVHVIAAIVTVTIKIFSTSPPPRADRITRKTFHCLILTFFDTTHFEQHEMHTWRC